MENVFWKDRNHILGLPIGLTRYMATPEKLVIRKGLLCLQQDQVFFYRMKDFQVMQGIPDRILGVGDVKIISSDPSAPELVLSKIKAPFEVSELLCEAMSLSRKQNNVLVGEGIQMHG